MTGMLAWRARPSTVAWSYTRATIPSTQRERLRATSGTDSREPMPISLRERYTPRPPSWMIPTSKVTRVRSDGFSKMRASVRPASAVECRQP